MTQEEIQSSEAQGQIDIKAILYNYMRHWHWFAISLGVCLFIAFLYLRYATPQYQVSSKVLIKDDKKGGASMDAAAAFSDLDIFKSNQNINNEIEVLKGKTLMYRVLKELNLETTFYTEGNIKTTEIYGRALPVNITLSSLDSTAFGKRIQLLIRDKNQFLLIDEEGEHTYSFGKQIKKSYATFTLTASNNVQSGKEIEIQFNDLSKLAAQYNQRISINTINKDASVLNISLVAAVPQKAEDIINKLIEVYNRDAIEDKNQIAENTVKFIDGRLNYLVTELEDVEKNVESYKRENQITDVSSEAQSFMQGAAEYGRQLADYQTQISVLESMEKYLQTAPEDGLVPSSMGIQDPTLVGLTSKYNELQLERQKLLQTVQPANPLIQSVDEQLQNLRGNIQENLSNIKRSLTITRNNLQSKTGGFKSRISQIPSAERNLLEIQREQGIKQALYGYLLQKREESAISLASAVSNTRIIDPAMTNGMPVSPKKMLVALLAFILGIMFPISGLYIKNLLDDKVGNMRDVEKITDAPVLGELVHHDEDHALVVQKGSRTAIAELFRLIRTNFQFAAPGKQTKVLMVTSSMSGEGKTFFSINMGASLALSGKRVVLLEFDIRKPKLMKDIGLSSKGKGFTSFLVNDDMVLSDIVQETKLVDNLWVIPSGPIPPNPAELLLNPKIEKLFDELRQQFDIIIVDTSPIGQVADAFSLAPYADVTAYLVRYNYTFKQQIHIVNDIRQNNKMPNLMVVLNDAKKENSHGYGYGYGYGSGYGYGDEIQSNTLKERLKRYLSR